MFNDNNDVLPVTLSWQKFLRVSTCFFTLTCGKMSLVQEAVFCLPGWQRVRLIPMVVWIFLGRAGLGWVNGTLSTWKRVIGVVCPYWDVPAF